MKKLFNISSLVGRFKNRIKIIWSYLKLSWDIYDWDYEFALIVEIHQLKRIRNYISKNHHYEGYEKDVRDMNRLFKLYEIIRENGCSYIENFEKDLEEKSIEEVFNQRHKWVLPVYVNTRNMHRFMSKINIKRRNEVLVKDGLRVLKAWNLYHKLKCYKMRNWWD